MKYRAFIDNLADDVRQKIYAKIGDDIYWNRMHKTYAPINRVIKIDIDDFECDRELIFNSALTSLKSL